MDDKDSRSPAPFGLDEHQSEKEKERLITRKRNRKGIPSKLVFRNENFSTSESFHCVPTEYSSNQYSSNQEGFDLKIIEGDFHPCSMTICAGEDIIAKITSFCNSCFCNYYIVSAVGSIARASILRCGNISTYEGWYEIVSLSGHVSIALNPGDGDSFQVSITLAAKNDSLFGGYVSGALIAATNCQVMLWKFTHSSVGETSAQDSLSTVNSPAVEMEIIETYHPKDISS